MQVLVSTFPSLGVEPQQHRAPHLLRRLLGTSAEFELHDACSARRPELEKYIAQCFQRAYQAEVTEFAPLLLELRCGHSTSGIAGLRPAGRAPLFFEHYLDVPVEEVAPELITRARKLGIIFGMDSESPDQTLRAMLEYEF